MDAFFVSVEELFDPVAQGQTRRGGRPPDERGVVSAASYAARKFGVHSAMPLRTAYKLCPQAIFVDGHPERYREYSARVYEVLQELFAAGGNGVDRRSVSGYDRHRAPARAAACAPLTGCTKRVKADTQLNCSIGIAASRLVAKISPIRPSPTASLW
jgi:DNA polymerase IV